MRTSRFALALAAAILVLGLFPAPVHSASPTLTLAEQEVIGALIPQASDSKKKVIKETTSVNELHLPENYDSFSSNLRKEAVHRDNEFKEALEDFLKKNKSPVQIVFPTNALEAFTLVSDATVKEIFSADRQARPNGWEVFYKRFPDSGGLVTISKVGLNSKGTVAIIYLGRQSGYRAGRGQIHVLRRTAGKWVLSSTDRIGPSWVS